MFRFIGIIIALGLVAWLTTRQVDDARNATQAAAKAAGVTGIKVDKNASPSEIAAEVGRAVEATAAESKARVDAAERAASE